tara:strand:- start:541 stop:1602 length:1062 start_codon:yes stop_codon:yes gene_type:complete
VQVLKIKTVAYKGSKRKLLQDIEKYIKEVDAKTVFDGFSGTGIVSAHLRSQGYEVYANDLNYSSYIYGKVFLEGYDSTIVNKVVQQLNSLDPKKGWITQNYSGEKERVVRGTGGQSQLRPLGFQAKNANKIDAARDYIETLSLHERNKNALIFSIILASDRVFNNSNDQKSSLKEWQTKALRDIQFESPTLITGPVGKQFKGDILKLESPEVDVVYLDPPYTHGVLYDACYHINENIALWDKPELDHSYALPRASRVAIRKVKKKSGGFYNKGTAACCFKQILGSLKCKRVILSYSDAPRNVLTIQDMCNIGKQYGNLTVYSKDHKICTQASIFNKVSTELKEYFLIIDMEEK